MPKILVMTILAVILMRIISKMNMNRKKRQIVSKIRIVRLGSVIASS